MVTEKGKSGFRRKALSLLLTLSLLAGLVPMAGTPVWAKTSGDYAYTILDAQARTAEITG